MTDSDHNCAKDDRKLPIDRPCSACSEDPEMEYHLHCPPFRGSAPQVEAKTTQHKDADTPDELTRWIWAKYVGVPVAGAAWGQEFENLLDRVRRMDRSSFTKGLHEGVRQAKTIPAAAGVTPTPATEPQDDIPLCADHAESWFCMRNHLASQDCVVCAMAAPGSTSVAGQGTDRCPQCGVSFDRWLLGKECTGEPHPWHGSQPAKRREK